MIAFLESDGFEVAIRNVVSLGGHRYAGSDYRKYCRGILRRAGEIKESLFTTSREETPLSRRKMRMKDILNRIKEKYNPQVIIVYGSYANGTNHKNSDFDALVIGDVGKKIHDVSFCHQVQLDVFVYPENYFELEVDCEEIVQIFDGLVVLDTDGKGQELKDRVCSYIAAMPKISGEKLSEEIAWCKKMCERAKRNDTEGMFRWHWLLTESLEIYCDLKGIYYFGPKKMIAWMHENDWPSYALYSNALVHLEMGALEKWIGQLEGLNQAVWVSKSDR